MAPMIIDRADPVKWLERLLEVNAASNFTSEQKIAIASALRGLMKQFGADVPTTR
jgi:hypothetical protein